MAAPAALALSARNLARVATLSASLRIRMQRVAHADFVRTDGASASMSRVLLACNRGSLFPSFSWFAYYPTTRTSRDQAIAPAAGGYVAEGEDKSLRQKVLDRDIPKLIFHPDSQ